MTTERTQTRVSGTLDPIVRQDIETVIAFVLGWWPEYKAAISWGGDLPDDIATADYKWYAAAQRLKDLLQVQELGAVRSSDLFGSFKAELWEDDEYVITCKAGVIGHTIDKQTAQWLPEWLNSAMAEAMTKLANVELTGCASRSPG